MKFQVFYCCNCGAVVNVSNTIFREYDDSGTGDSTAFDDVIPCCDEPNFVWGVLPGDLDRSSFSYDFHSDSVDLKNDRIKDRKDRKVDRVKFMLER